MLRHAYWGLLSLLLCFCCFTFSFFPSLLPFALEFQSLSSSSLIFGFFFGFSLAVMLAHLQDFEGGGDLQVWLLQVMEKLDRVLGIFECCWGGIRWWVMGLGVRSIERNRL